MKRYLRNIFFISCLFILFVAGVAIIRMIIIKNHSWQLPEDVHIVFMGASHVNRAIDDSMMRTAINWSRPSERYMFTYIKLQHLLAENPQLDTIFLELAPTDIWEDTDYKYHDLNEQTGYVKLYWPFFSSDNWSIYTSEMRQVLGLVVKSLLDTEDLSQSGWWGHMGGYKSINGVMDTTMVKPQLEKNQGYGFQVNYLYLNKIMEICRSHKVHLIFIETPTWHPEYFYDQEYYYDVINTRFNNVEFVDYSRFPIPVDEFYDAHHLNEKGARHFTKEIKERFNIQ